MSDGSHGFRRWRAIRDGAFAAHVAADDDAGRSRAIATLFTGMSELRAALDDDDAAIFDAMLRRDHAAMLLAESTVDGAVDETRLQRVVQRELRAGRGSAHDAVADVAAAFSTLGTAGSAHLAR